MQTWWQIQLACSDLSTSRRGHIQETIQHSKKHPTPLQSLRAFAYEYWLLPPKDNAKLAQHVCSCHASSRRPGALITMFQSRRARLARRSGRARRRDRTSRPRFQYLGFPNPEEAENSGDVGSGEMDGV